MAMKFTGLATCIALAMLMVPGTVGPSAQAAATTPVLKTELAGAEGTEANIVLFDVEAGWETERHIHPGHVFVYVTEGSIQVDVEGSEPRTVAAGDAFYELPDRPMVARTASADEGAKFIVFQVGPAGEALMVAHPN